MSCCSVKPFSYLHLYWHYFCTLYVYKFLLIYLCDLYADLLTIIILIRFLSVKQLTIFKWPVSGYRVGLSFGSLIEALCGVHYVKTKEDDS